MLEGLMALSLVIMGIYFVKSTDLPKEMQNRSAQMERETVASPKKKMAFEANKVSVKTEVKVEIKKSNTTLIDLHNKAIDELTLKITTLEQELKINNARNNEIQKEIDTHLASLRLLNDKISALS
jgi:hypothetical protein